MAMVISAHIPRHLNAAGKRGTVGAIKSDTLIKHQPFGVEMLIPINMTGSVL
jgi:hypothetical protein